MIDPEMHRRFWLAFAEHLGEGALFVGLVWTVARLLRDAPSRITGTVWWLTFWKLVVPFGLIAPVLARVAGAWQQAAPMVSVYEAFRPLGSWIESSRSELWARSAGYLYPLLSALWLGSVLTWIAWALAQRGRMLREVRPAPRRLAEAARSVGIPARRVRCSDEAPGPCLVGVLQPRIVVPGALVECLGGAELQAVLVHENTHRLRRDGYKAMAASALLLVLWFFPPAWFVVRKLRQQLELACDEAVLEAGVDRGLYVRTLAKVVDFGLGGPLAGVAMGDARAGLSGRLRRMLEPGSRSMRKRHGIALMCVAVGLTGLAVAHAAVVGGAAQAQAAASAERQRVRRMLSPDFPELLRLRGVEQRIDLNLDGVALDSALARIGAAAGIAVRLHDVDTSQPVHLRAQRSSVGEILAALGAQHGLSYRVDEDRRTLLVGPVLRLSKGIEPPRRVHYVQPEYPPRARDRGVEGVVVMSAVLLRDGRLGRLGVVRGVDPELDRSAIEAARQWRYQPVLVDGQPVEVELMMTVSYRLRHR